MQISSFDCGPLYEPVQPPRLHDVPMAMNDLSTAESAFLLVSSSICFLKFALIVGVSMTSGVLTSGRFAGSAIGFRSTGLMSTSIDGSDDFFTGSSGFSFECLPLVQPMKLRNSVKSVLFLLQHDQPL